MTITKDPSTTTSHQPQLPRLDPETTGRSDKQSPNRAGIPMLRGARHHRAQGSNHRRAMSQIAPCACDRWGF
jgi:hypothetical protein